MKKCLGFWMALCMSVSCMAMSAAASTSTGTGFDFEGEYTYDTYSSKYYISSNGTNLYMTSAGVDETTAKSYIISDADENKVLNMPETIKAVVAKTDKNAAEMKIKKMTTAGSFTLEYCTSTWSQGDNRGGTTLKLLTFDAEGNIKDFNDEIVGTYSAERWMSVNIRFDDSRQYANISVTQADGKVVYANLERSAAPTIDSSATLAAYVFTNSGATVYLDDFDATQDTDAFALYSPFAGGADVDFEFASGYSWNVYQGAYAKNVWFYNSSSKEAALKEIIKDADGDKVVNLNPNEGYDLGIVRSRTSTMNGYSFEIKKLENTGTLTVQYRNQGNGAGANYGGTASTLFSFDSDGYIVDARAGKVGTYTAGKWYVVELSHEGADGNIWNITVTDRATGAKTYVSAIHDTYKTTSGQGSNCAVALCNNGGTVYFDDLSGKTVSDFRFTDPGHRYSYDGSLTEAITSETALSDGDTFGGAKFTVNTGASATAAPVELGGEKAIKVSATRMANSNVNTGFSIPTANVKNPLAYIAAFQVGVNSLGSENYVTAKIYNGSNVYNCKILNFNSNGTLEVYQSGYNQNAIMQSSGITWKKDALYNCVLIHDYAKKICRFYVEDVDGTLYSWNYDNTTLNTNYLQGLTYNFRAYSGTANAYYVGKNSMLLYSPDCEYIGSAPENNAKGVTTSGTIDMNYSDYVAPNSDYAVHVVDEDGNPVMSTYDVLGKTIRITPTGFEKGKIYTVSVGTVKDIYGNSVSAADSVSFETVRAFDIKSYQLNDAENGRLTKGSNTVSALISAQDDTYDVVVIGAVYNKKTGQMMTKGAQKWTITPEDGEKSVSATFDASNLSGDISDYEVHLYLWKGFSAPKAYADVKIFSVAE